MPPPAPLTPAEKRWRRLYRAWENFVEMMFQMQYLIAATCLWPRLATFAARSTSLHHMLPQYTAMLMAGVSGPPLAKPDTQPPPSPDRCPHVTATGATACKRYGNASGRYSKCQLCDRKWKWADESDRWEVFSPARPASSSQLPPPSSADTVPSKPEMHQSVNKPPASSNSRPASSSKPTVSPTSKRAARSLHQRAFRPRPRPSNSSLDSGSLSQSSGDGTCG